MKSFSPFFLNKLLLVLALIYTGCVKDITPYPHLEGEITDILVEGMKSADIDMETRTVTLHLADTMNLERVRLYCLYVNEGSHILNNPDSLVDLTTPLTIKIESYPGQIYEWTILAENGIEYDFSVRNQIGSTVYNKDEHQVLVYVPFETRYDNIQVLSAKLGPLTSTIEPDPTTVHDFTSTRSFKVRYKEEETVWIVQVLHKDVPVETYAADAWAKKAYLSGSYKPSLGSPHFKYRQAGQDEWIDVSDNIDIKDGKASACIEGLTPNTKYEYVAFAGDTEGDLQSFTTELEAQVPNMNFDDWWLSGKVWFPNPEGNSTYCWDTANKGATLLGGPSSTNPEENHVVKGKACHMESIALIGVFAAGNIYTGIFVERQGTNAIIDQGWPFSSRPVTFHGYYDYKPVIVNKAKAPYLDEKGKMDKGLIYACLLDWSAQHRVNSSDKSTIINLDTDPSVIALARIELDDTDGEYKEFNIDFEYRDNRKPTYVLICCCASRYADDFTGGVGSTLYIDEFEFLY